MRCDVAGMDKLHEECGLFGLLMPESVKAAWFTSVGLIALQHRGQESAGIAWEQDGKIAFHKGLGLAGEVFTPDVLCGIEDSRLAIGHVRYSTTGSNNTLNSQPLITLHSKLSFALAHNGNITNAAELHQSLEESGTVFSTTNDSEVINMCIIRQMLKTDSVEAAVLKAAQTIQGAFSLLIMTGDKLIALRDPTGFHPLCMGRLNGGVVFASETCALDAVGADFERYIEPGEMVVADSNMKVTSYPATVPAKRGLCVFELIYFARPDSIIDGESVYHARQRMGRFLAKQRPVDADIVCPVPDSGMEAAQGYAQESGIPLGTAFVKNRYIGRSFIAPSQLAREQAVNIKLNPLRASVAGRRVVLVDDSIVRGTTCARIIRALRKAGAKEVHMRISSPPFLYPCFFGTDIDSSENLIAHNHSVEEIRQMIDADTLEYLSIENLEKVKSLETTQFCNGCFSGVYPVDTGHTHLKEAFEDK